MISRDRSCQAAINSAVVVLEAILTKPLHPPQGGSCIVSPLLSLEMAASENTYIRPMAIESR